MASSVQFYGPDQVITAAANRECAAWAMFQGRQFLFKSPEGATLDESLAMLTEILESISVSDATYTLKFYEDLQGKKIKENTPCDGSFNFKLKPAADIEERKTIYRESGQFAALLTRMDERLAALEEQDEQEEEEPQTLGGVLAGLANDPQKIIQLIEVGKAIFGMNKNNSMGELARVAGAPDPADKELQPIIARLRAADPHINAHLEKLAQLAEQQPEFFKMIISQLEKM